MKRLLTIALFLLSGSIAFSQKEKIDVKGDTVYVSGVKQFIVESKMMATQFLVKSMDGQMLMTFFIESYNHPSKVNNANTQGREVYCEVTFIGSGQKCDFDPMGASKKMIAKQILDNNLIKEGKTDTDAENLYVMVNGRRFAEERNRLQSGGGTNGNGGTNINININK